MDLLIQYTDPGQARGCLKCWKIPDICQVLRCHETCCMLAGFSLTVLLARSGYLTTLDLATAPDFVTLWPANSRSVVKYEYAGNYRRRCSPLLGEGHSNFNPASRRSELEEDNSCATELARFRHTFHHRLTEETWCYQNPHRNQVRSVHPRYRHHRPLSEMIECSLLLRRVNRIRRNSGHCCEGIRRIPFLLPFYKCASQYQENFSGRLEVGLRTRRNFE